MRFRVAQVERIHDHADVGGVLARLADVGYLDELKARLMHAGLDPPTALPVPVCLLDDDRALQQQPLEHPIDVELCIARIAHAERDVLKITEEREIGELGVTRHAGSPMSLYRVRRFSRGTQ